MHESLKNIQEKLEELNGALRSALPNDQPFGIGQGNWSFPNLSRSELVADIQSIIDLIEAEGGDDVGEQEALLSDYPRRLQYVQQNTIQNLVGNAGLGVPALLFTLDGLRTALEPVLTGESHKQAIAKLKKLSTQIRGLEARVAGLEPRAATIDDKVVAIERAYDTADRLPETLESLEEAKKGTAKVVQDATKDGVLLSELRNEGETIRERLRAHSAYADDVLKRCETAYSAATSVGLAAAFTERSRALAWSMWVWVLGLVAALVIGSFFGTERLKTLVELFKDPNQSASVIIPNVVLSILAVGAPIWLAWLSTKQVGQRFRLSEDYAFKASISRAYEGFRREAARIDKELEARLLASALNRLDELPLRLVDFSMALRQFCRRRLRHPNRRSSNPKRTGTH
jgi:hypothetical protein